MQVPRPSLNQARALPNPLHDQGNRSPATATENSAEHSRESTRGTKEVAMQAQQESTLEITRGSTRSPSPKPCKRYCARTWHLALPQLTSFKAQTKQRNQMKAESARAPNHGFVCKMMKYDEYEMKYEYVTYMCSVFPHLLFTTQAQSEAQAPPYFASRANRSASDCWAAGSSWVQHANLSLLSQPLQKYDFVLRKESVQIRSNLFKSVQCISP